MDPTTLCHLILRCTAIDPTTLCHLILRCTAIDPTTLCHLIWYRNLDPATSASVLAVPNVPGRNVHAVLGHLPSAAASKLLYDTTAA